MIVSGRHELIFMVGQPTAQTKSPGLMNGWFDRQGIDCVLVPLTLPGASLRSAVDIVRHGENVRGAIVTLPFKSAVGQYVDDLTETSRTLNAVNVIRKTKDGQLHGDMLDGKAMLRAIQARGLDVRSRQVFLAGCGGAGSAMAFNACAAGACGLRLTDIDADRAAALVAVLSARFPDCDIGVAATPGSCDILINATPLGMRTTDPLPIALDHASPATLVVDAVTSPSSTTWASAGQARGATVIDGNALAGAQLPLLLEFFGFH